MWLLRDGEVLAAAEMADSLAGTQQGPARHAELRRRVPDPPHERGSARLRDALCPRCRLPRPGPGRGRHGRVSRRGASPGPGGSAAPSSKRSRAPSSVGGCGPVTASSCTTPGDGARRIDRGDSAADGRLVIVSTPIGNLGDLSTRAVDVLGHADLVCCEDTRRTRALLTHAGITGRRLLSLHARNEAARVRRGPRPCGGRARRWPW